MASYVVYILYSKRKNRYYIGFTVDVLTERIRRHNSNHNGFTGGIGDWSFYKEEFEEKSLALGREKEIKRWKSRIKIEKLISGR